MKTLGTLSLKTAPTIDALTLTEIKAHARIDISDDDAFLGTLIKAATAYIETLTGIRFVTQVWNYYLDAFPSDDVIELPIGPVSDVVVKYLVKDAGSPSTFAASSYAAAFAGLEPRIVLKDGQSWPSDTLEIVNGVIIEITAGYSITGGTTSDAPANLKAALKFLIAYLYENREAAAGASGGTDVKKLPFASDTLLADFRMWQR